MSRGAALIVFHSIVWLDTIVDKIRSKHGVEPDEVEEVLFGKPRIHWQERGHYATEDVYYALGRTYAGRYLVVYFILKSDRRALVVSAREMNERERRQYGRK